MSINISNLEKYRQFLSDTYAPIFSQIYWLDVVCDKEWDVWFFESGGNVIAAMPYQIIDRAGYRIVTRPTLTQNNGILLSKLEQQKNSTREANQEQIIGRAVDYIQSLNLDLFEQQFHFSFTNWLPFFWEKYSALVRYTYIIQTKGLTLNDIFATFDSKLRNCIRKAEKEIHVTTIMPDEFYSFYTDIFKKKSIKPSISKQKWLELFSACEKQNVIQLLKAEQNLDIQSIACFVEDDRAVYLLMGGTSAYTKSNCAYDYLIWRGIQYAYAKGKYFDFEGSVLKSVNQSIRKFGGQAMPYFRIRKVFNRELRLKEFMSNDML